MVHADLYVQATCQVIYSYIIKGWDLAVFLPKLYIFQQLCSQPYNHMILVMNSMTSSVVLFFTRQLQFISFRGGKTVDCRCFLGLSVASPICLPLIRRFDPRLSQPSLSELFCFGPSSSVFPCLSHSVPVLCHVLALFRCNEHHLKD